MPQVDGGQSGAAVGPLGVLLKLSRVVRHKDQAGKWPKPGRERDPASGSWALRWRSWAALETFVGVLAPLLGPLWAVLGRSWGLCWRSWAVLSR